MLRFGVFGLRCSLLRLRMAPLAPHPSDAPCGAPFRPFVLGPSVSAGPPVSSFAFAADDAFDPGLADPLAPEPKVPVPRLSLTRCVQRSAACMRISLTCFRRLRVLPPILLFYGPNLRTSLLRPHPLISRYSLHGLRESVRLWRRLTLGWLLGGLTLLSSLSVSLGMRFVGSLLRALRCR